MRACPIIVLLALGLPLLAPRAGAVDLTGRDIRLRVMAKSVPVRTGPGGSYREVARVGLDQVYEAIDRSPDGAWYRIRLARGLTGWVLAELVWPFEVVDDDAGSQAKSWLYQHLLGPSRLGEGTISLALAAGTMETDGLFTVRLGVQPNRHVLFEIMAGQAVGHLGSMLFYGAEMLVCIGPWRTLVPFAALGGGGTTTLPHREGRLFAESTRPMLSAGGGILLALRGALTLRIDARQIMVFSADGLSDMLTISGGLMLTF